MLQQRAGHIDEAPPLQGTYRRMKNAAQSQACIAGMLVGLVEFVLDISLHCTVSGGIRAVMFWQLNC